MADLLTTLESFNRKERFFLVAQALNDERPAQQFKLSETFRQELGEAVGVTIPTEKVFVAMDYHLNWVHASLVLSHHTDESERRSRLDIEGTTEANQQDIDLLVAFNDTGNRYQLIFVEAKGYDGDGFAGFGKDELGDKVRRLDKIINSNGKPKYGGVDTHFCLASGYDPQNRTKDWPQWNGKPLHWMPLSLPDTRRVVNYSDFSIVELSKGKGAKAFDKTAIVQGR